MSCILLLVSIILSLDTNIYTNIAVTLRAINHKAETLIFLWNKMTGGKKPLILLIVNQAEKLGIKIHYNHTIVNTNGYKRINSIEIMNDA